MYVRTYTHTTYVQCTPIPHTIIHDYTTPSSNTTHNTLFHPHTAHIIHSSTLTHYTFSTLPHPYNHTPYTPQPSHTTHVYTPPTHNHTPFTLPPSHTNSPLWLVVQQRELLQSLTPEQLYQYCTCLTWKSSQRDPEPRPLGTTSRCCQPCVWNDREVPTCTCTWMGLWNSNYTQCEFSTVYCEFITYTYM